VGSSYIEPMTAIPIRTAAWLLALLTLALPHVVGDSGRAVTRSDAPFASTTHRDTRVLRLQSSGVVRTERQRLSDGGPAVLPSGAALLLFKRSTPPTLRLTSLALRLWPRVGHERDPPAT
jgi:hypothetical protein